MQFLKTKGTCIVSEDGCEVLLKGYGIGNWMNQEGFLFGSSQFHLNLNDFQRAGNMDRGRSIDQIIRELCGARYAADFWKQWHHNYFAKEDIINLSQEGFNSIRIPLAAKVFLKEEAEISFIHENFEWLDQIIDWCEEYEIYVILDMHAAVAGQSGILCDDGVDNVPHLFLEEEAYERTILLWETLATRYAKRAVIAGYDLLNEPLALPKHDKYLPKLLQFYKDVIERIRKIDQKHILFLEGHRFSSRADLFEKNMDPVAKNWVFTPHIYETLPDLGLIGPLLSAAERLEVPVFVGETGGNKEWMTTLYEMLYENHIGVNVWCHKCEASADAASLLTFQLPDGFDKVLRYVQEGCAKPPYEEAIHMFDCFLEAVKFENCTRHHDNACAILRKPGVKVPAIAYNMLPGAGISFSGNYPYCAFCGYRREDRMHFVHEVGYIPFESPAFGFCAVEKNPKYGDFMNLQLKLYKGDFASYQIRDLVKECTIRIACLANKNATLKISYRDKEVIVAVSAAESVVTLEVGKLEAGDDTTVKVACSDGEIVLYHISFL